MLVQASSAVTISSMMYLAHTATSASTWAGYLITQYLPPLSSSGVTPSSAAAAA